MVKPAALGNGTKGAEGQTRWSLRLFGGFQLSELANGERVALPGKRERVLLAYLALSPNCRAARRKLATLLWGDATDETALDNLRTCVWSLRKTLGDATHRILASEGEDIVLDATVFEVDALSFRKLAVRPERKALEQAAKLYTGDFLDSLGIENDEFETWRREEAGRFKDQAIDGLNRLMIQLSEAGESERAIAVGLEILRLEPLHETSVRRLMRLYAEGGRRGAAVQLFRVLSEALKTELDAQPEAETHAVYAKIACGDAPAPATAALEAAPRSVSVRESPVPMPTPRTQFASAIGPPWRIELPRAKTRWLTFILAGGLAAILASFLLYQLAPSASIQTPPSGIEAAHRTAASQASLISIAVLPFVNLSGDPAQEFFSDGITEEITSALAKVPNLRVVARTSAFQFKGQNKDLRAVGQALAATHLIEGSVRKDGDRLRITVQLIKADDGTHVWSEDYDRELTDIFGIQEDIARAITTALRVPLGLSEGRSLLGSRAIDADFYQQYLRAKSLVRFRRPKPESDAAAILEQLVARNPNYAPAWGLLAQAYAFFTPSTGDDPQSLDQELQIAVLWNSKAEQAAQRAIQLDASLAEEYLSLGVVQATRSKLVQAEDLFKRALALDPNNPDVLHAYVVFLASVGHAKAAQSMASNLHILEPFVPAFSRITARVLWLNGNDDAAITILKNVPSDFPLARTDITRIYAASGDYREAADTLKGLPAGALKPDMIKHAERLLRMGPAAAASQGKLPDFGAPLNFIYVYAGTPDRVLESYEREIEAGYLSPVTPTWLWHPSFAPVRKMERFKAFVRKAGFVDYWRAKGWPEQCHPTTGDDFTCG